MTQTSRALEFAKPDAQTGGAKEATLRFALRAYKAVLSPLLHAVSPGRCLYLPTCSEYAYTAVQRFGVARGSWLALRRLARCHPWGNGGLDPVPQLPASERSSSAQAAPGQNGADHLP